MKTVNISVHITKGGQPALWESGGGRGRTGWAQVIAAPDGSPKRPLFVRRAGHLALGDHAQVPVGPGDYIVWARRGGGETHVEVIRVEDVDPEKALAIGTAVAEQVDGEWSSPPPAHLGAAIAAAVAKATCYHCRGPHFVLNEE